MAVKQVTGATFVEEVLESDRPVVVDFYADWCLPCRVVSPIIEALAEEWEGEVAFARVDVGHEPKLSTALHIVSIPTVMRFEGGRAVARSIGAKSRRAIERQLGLRRDGREGDGRSGLLDRLRSLFGHW